MSREGDFSAAVKEAALIRQDGMCACCGAPLQTPWTLGPYTGEAHHLKPLVHGGTNGIDNCVYLCPDHHKLLGHGMAPGGIDKQGGSSDTWVQLDPTDFQHWDGDK